MILNDLVKVMAANSGYYYYYLPAIAAAVAFPVHPLTCYSKVAIMLAEVTTDFVIIAAAVTNFATDAILPMIADSSSADST